MDRGDNIPRMNVVRLPPIGALEAETFVRAVAQDVFANDEERDLTLAKAAEWFEAKATSIFPETPGTEISSPTAAGLFFADWVRIVEDKIDVFGSVWEYFIVQSLPTVIQPTLVMICQNSPDEAGQRQHLSLEVLERDSTEPIFGASG